MNECFGWSDINVYKLGVQWKANDVWTWRAGYEFEIEFGYSYGF